MSTYAVCLNEPNKKAWDALRQQWPGRHFILTDHMAFVAPEGITTTAEIAEAIGMEDEEEVLGLVFEWAAYSGFNRGELWEWLRKVQS